MRLKNILSEKVLQMFGFDDKFIKKICATKSIWDLSKLSHNQLKFPNKGWLEVLIAGREQLDSKESSNHFKEIFNDI